MHFDLLERDKLNSSAELKKMRKQEKQILKGKDKQNRDFEKRELNKQIKIKKLSLVQEIFQESVLVCSTLNSLYSNNLQKYLKSVSLKSGSEYFEKFDWVLIDEAGQADEPSCLMGLLCAKRAILAGDHLQLPPTLKSSFKQSGSAEGNWENYRTLFEKLIRGRVGRIKSTMLQVQYRMEPEIMHLVSALTYNHKLRVPEGFSDKNFYNSLLQKSANKEVVVKDLIAKKVLFIDTSKQRLFESMEVRDLHKANLFATSKQNLGEAHLTLFAVLTCVIDLGFGLRDIGVISPYNAQVRRIREGLKTILDSPEVEDKLAALKHKVSQFVETNSPEKIEMLGDIWEKLASAGALHEQIEINSVDSFQGREKEVVIISTVRSNESGQIGFLEEFRRTNVAISRAKKFLIVIGDGETLAKQNQFFERFVEEIQKVAKCVSAWDVNMSEWHTHSFCENHLRRALTQVGTGTGPDKGDAGVGELVNRFADVFAEEGTKSKVLFKVRIEKYTTKARNKKTEKPREKAKQGKKPKKKTEKIQESRMETAIEKSIREKEEDEMKRVQEFVDKVRQGGIAKQVFEFRVSEKSRARMREDCAAQGIAISFKGPTLTVVDLKKERQIREENDEKEEVKEVQETGETHENETEKEGKEKQEPKKKRKRKRKRKKKKKMTEEEQEKANLAYLDEISAFREIESKKCLYSKAWNQDGKVVKLIPKHELESTKYCGKNIKFLFQLCKCCDRKYCLTHAVPEVHGCGNEARAKARHQMQTEFHNREFMANEVDERKKEELKERARRKIMMNQRKRMSKQARKNLMKMKKKK